MRLKRGTYPAADLLDLALSELRLRRRRQVALQWPSRREVGVGALRRPHPVAPPFRGPLPRQHCLPQTRAGAQNNHRSARAAQQGHMSTPCTSKAQAHAAECAHWLACVECEDGGGVQRGDAVADGLEVVHHAHRRRAQLLLRGGSVDDPRQVGERAAVVGHGASSSEARRGRRRTACFLGMCERKGLTQGVSQTRTMKLECAAAGQRGRVSP